MKSVVGFMFFLLFLAGLFLVFLQGKQMTGQIVAGGGAELTGVRWQPTYIGPEAVPGDAGMWVEFAVDGGINGHAGCNTFFGSLTQTDSGIAVGPLGSTRMACPEPIMSRESAFLSALQQATEFEVSADRMTSLDADRTLLIEFAAAEITDGE